MTPKKIKSIPNKPVRSIATGIAAFADGGAVGADGLTDAQRAKLNGARSSLGISATPPVPPQPERPQAQALPPQQGIATGIVGILKNRGQQIDKASGYARGGIVRGIGTPTSDSIPAEVRETGEPIRVSTGERIVSKAQGDFLENVAKNAGYDGLDHLFKDAGLPVGPTIKAGKKAAAEGWSVGAGEAPTIYDNGGLDEETVKRGASQINSQLPALSAEADPFAFRGGKEFGAAGPVNGPASGIMAGLNSSASADASATTQPGRGIAAEARLNPLARGLSDAVQTNTASTNQPASQGIVAGINPLAQAANSGRDANGIITADSAAAASGNPMARSGGIAGGIDMAGVNGIMQRENDIRQSMIDARDKRDGVPAGGWGPSILGDGGIAADNAEKTARWRQDDLLRDARNGNQIAVGAALKANAQTESEALRSAGTTANDQARNALTARSQDMGLLKAKDRNGIIERGQDMRAMTADNRIASNETIAGARIAERSGPTLSQQRGNAEIDASRERIAGMDDAEIKRRTANFTSTGRENPDYDPTLAKAVSLANRRKVGDDLHFDERQQTQQPAGNDGDTMTRFRADQQMRGHKTGQMTDSGLEVFDASGRLIGHYR